MIIYKYLPPSRIDVLETQSLRCTPADKLNDEFEMRPYFDNIIDPSQIDDLFTDVEIDFDEIKEKLYTILTSDKNNTLSKNEFTVLIDRLLQSSTGKNLIENSKVLTVDLINKMKPQFQKEIYKTNIKTTGKISFSESFNSNEMWGLYSDSHKGYQIGFKGDHYFFNKPRGDGDEFFRLRKVIYDSNKNIKSLYGAEGKDILLKKQGGWKYEKEWCILVPLFLTDTVNKNNEDIHLVKYPTDCIESIIFGTKSSEKLKDTIYRLVDSKKLRRVKVGQMFVDNNKSNLDVAWLNNQ